jgi:hypothetical protein
MPVCRTSFVSTNHCIFSSFVCSFFFLVGSFYFVSGSYPHASQFYYSPDRGKNDEEAPKELYFDEIGTNHDRHQMRLSIPNLNIFDGPQPILKHHVPGMHGDGDGENVLSPLHGDHTAQRKTALLTPTTHVRQMDAKDKKKKKAESTAASSSISTTAGSKPMPTLSSSTSSALPSTLPPPPAYVPIAPKVMLDENRDDDDEEIDDRDRYQSQGPSAAALVMSGRNGSPMK